MLFENTSYGIYIKAQRSAFKLSLAIKKENTSGAVERMH